MLHDSPKMKSECFSIQVVYAVPHFSNGINYASI